MDNKDNQNFARHDRGATIMAYDFVNQKLVTAYNKICREIFTQVQSEIRDYGIELLDILQAVRGKSSRTEQASQF